MISLDKIESHTIPMEEFELKWRFTEEQHNVLPKQHLAAIHPLNKDASESLGNHLFDTGLMGQYKLNKEHFSSISKFDLRKKSEKDGRNWLDNLNVDSKENVFLFWDSYVSAITNWDIFKMYYDDFYYPVSDDLILTNKNVNWILYFFHEEIVSFGLRK